MNITVFGSGYVGLVTGACLADVGHRVMCVDVDSEKVTALRNGIVPIYEPGLEELIRRNQNESRLQFTDVAQLGIDFGEILFIAVGTPPDEDGSADLKHVLSVAADIGRCMAGRKVVVNKSTVPVGTADAVSSAINRQLIERQVRFDFDVCSNPEFLKEGAAIEDFTRGARIIIGTNSEYVKYKMKECYAPYNRNHDKIIYMDVKAAELTKYAANAMLATKISFMNEMANIAERLGVDIEQVRHGIGSDPRIGYHFIYPGCGYGGACFPKDVSALARTSSAVGYQASLLHAVQNVNKRQKTVLFDKLMSAFNGQLSGKTIAIWGLSFKPNTDDIREAPSRVLMESLWAVGAKVRAFDPEAMSEIRRAYGSREDLLLVDSQDEAIVSADALVICTEWRQFRAVDFKAIKAHLNHPVLVDGRNIFDPTEARSAGLKYYAVGRGDSLHHD